MTRSTYSIPNAFWTQVLWLSVAIFTGCVSSDDPPSGTDEGAVETESRPAASSDSLRDGDPIGTDLAVPLLLIAEGDDLAEALAGAPANVRLQLSPVSYALTRSVTLGGANVTVFTPGPGRAQITVEFGAELAFVDCEACSVRGVEFVVADGQIAVGQSRVTFQQCSVELPGYEERPAISVASGGHLEARTCTFQSSGRTVASASGGTLELRGVTFFGPRAGGRGGADVDATAIGAETGGILVLEESRVTGFASGVRAFGARRLEIRENVFENLSSVGVQFSQTGEFSAFVEDNAFFRIGACGVAGDLIAAESPSGYVSKNVFVRTNLVSSGSDVPARCLTHPVAIETTGDLNVRDNLFHTLGPGTVLLSANHGTVLDEASFIERTMDFYTFHVEPQDATRSSDFMSAFEEKWGPPFR